MKRQRSNSISGRLRSASDLEERGLIDRYQKGILKDLIISGDEQLQSALDRYERGDPSELEALMDRGVLNRKSSLDLLEDLDMGFLNVGQLGRASAGDASQMHKDEPYMQQQPQFDLDEIPFEATFGEEGGSRHLDVNPQQNHELHRMMSHHLPHLPDDTHTQTVAQFNFPDAFERFPRPFDQQGLVQDVLGQGAVELSPPPAYSDHTQNQLSNEDPSVSLDIDDDSDRGPKRFIGAYSPEARRKRIARFIEKRKRRVWTKKVKYDVRKNFADSRLRVKGRFVKKEDEELLRELIGMT